MSSYRCKEEELRSVHLIVIKLESLEGSICYFPMEGRHMGFLGNKAMTEFMDDAYACAELTMKKIKELNQ